MEGVDEEDENSKADMELEMNRGDASKYVYLHNWHSFISWETVVCT